MGDAPRPDELGGSGLPVGLASSADAAARPATAVARVPSWVAPMVVLALVAGLGIGLAVGLLIGGNDGSGRAATTTTAAPTSTAPWETSDAYGGAVTIVGNPLPVLGSATTDTAVGLPLPQISGTDFAGNPLTIAANGKAKLIVALAHWCPYCNSEVPILRDWYAAGIPEGVEVISLSVYTDPTRSNFPPAAWLSDAGWNLPLIADDDTQTLVATLGIPAVPFWLIVAADGTILERATGQVPTETLDRIIATLLESAGGLTPTTIP